MDATLCVDSIPCRARIPYTAKAVMPYHAVRGFHTVQARIPYTAKAVIGGEERGHPRIFAYGE